METCSNPKADEDGEEYVCLGDVFSNSKDHAKPSLDKMACIKKNVLRQQPIRKRAIWNSKIKMINLYLHVIQIIMNSLKIVIIRKIQMNINSLKIM